MERRYTVGSYRHIPRLLPGRSLVRKSTANPAHRRSASHPRLPSSGGRSQSGQRLISRRSASAHKRTASSLPFSISPSPYQQIRPHIPLHNVRSIGSYSHSLDRSDTKPAYHRSYEASYLSDTTKPLTHRSYEASNLSSSIYPVTLTSPYDNSEALDYVGIYHNRSKYHQPMLAMRLPEHTGRPHCETRQQAMASYNRLPSIDMDEQIDLSTKTEKELKAMVKDLRSRYRSTMMHNAHMDNEKQALQYHVEDLQDQLVEEQSQTQTVTQELRDWNRKVEEEKRTQLQLDLEMDRLKNMIMERDQLIKDSKLVMVPLDVSSPKPSVCTDAIDTQSEKLVRECAERKSSLLFEQTIRDLVEENERIKVEIVDARKNLADLREKNSIKSRELLKPSYTDSASKISEIKRLEHEQDQLLNDYKQQVNNAYLKIDSMESQLLRLEAQMHRYREMYDESEKTQQAIKSENRKLSRKIEETKREADERERECKHLETRIEKVKTARNNAYNGGM